MRKLWLIQAVGNALLLWLAYRWTGIADARTSQLIETAVLGFVLLIAWLWMTSTTMAFCSDPTSGLAAAAKSSLRSLFWFAIVALALFALIRLLAEFNGPMDRAGRWTASWLTYHLRRPVKPELMGKWFQDALCALRWVLLPVLAIPLAGTVATRGRAGLRLRGSFRFLVAYCVALAAGYYIPHLLIGWVPKLTGTYPQLASFVVRATISYVLAITAWLAILYYGSRTKPISGYQGGPK